MSASSPALSTSPEPMRTWKMEGPPEMVEGMVMKVMTSCSLRPARRARKPPMAWIPSWELPAKRMTASEILETLEPPLPVGAVRVDATSLIKVLFLTQKASNVRKRSARWMRYACEITRENRVRPGVWGVKLRLGLFKGVELACKWLEENGLGDAALG